MNTQIRRTVTSWLVILLLVSACGQSASTPPGEEAGAPAVGAADGTLPAVDPTTIDGAITISGSSTVFLLTSAMAEEFREDGSAADIDVRSIGTGAGFHVFCNGENLVDIVDASRPIRDEEQATCEEQGLPPVEFQIGMDALAIVVNDENDFLESLTIEELAQIFSGEAANWSDIDPSYPAEPIALFSPGVDSGTFDIFVEEVFGGDEQPIQNAPDIVLSESDFELSQGIVANPYAIGYFGFAYYVDSQDTLDIVAIDDGSGNAVAPTAETVEDGSYPFARPLFIYSSPTIMAEKPYVAAFVNYYLQHVNEIIEDVGYFPASASALEEGQQTFIEATQ